MARDTHITEPGLTVTAAPLPPPRSLQPCAAHRLAPSAGHSAKATVIKAPKARSADACERLEQLPNIGPALAADLRRIGIQHPAELRGQDPLALYQQLCRLTGQRHDPCVLDTFMAATDFMGGAPAAPWWAYTPLRKSRFGAV